MVRILMIGDVVGRPGRRAVDDNLLELVQGEKIDFVIANGENAAGGIGITKAVAQQLFNAGIEVITTGNHVWDKKDAIKYIAKQNNILRPANYPPGTPGAGFGVFDTKTGCPVGVISLLGKIFISELDCPFRSMDHILANMKDQCSVILLDFHAEATSEKAALAHYLDGRVSAVCGTHTHVQTADERILPEGTAFITDVGMTGPVDSIIGVQKEPVIERFLTQMPRKFEVAAGLYQFNAVVIDIDSNTGLALNIRRIQNYE